VGEPLKRSVLRLTKGTKGFMVRSIQSLLCLTVIGACFVISCGQTPQAKLINEVNAAWIKARELGDEAERRRAQAREKSASGDHAEHDKLIQEAADLYQQAADSLNGASDKTHELAKQKQPKWYEEYFSLQSKLMRNLAQLAVGAHDELLARMRGAPSESQVQFWNENITRIRKENDELWTQIKTIEKREGLVLIKE